MGVITTIGEPKACCTSYEELLLKEVIRTYCGTTSEDEEPIPEPPKDDEDIPTIDCEPTKYTFEVPRPKLILTESLTVPSVAFPNGQAVYFSETEEEFINNIAKSAKDIAESNYAGLVELFKETGARISGGGMITWDGKEDSLKPINSLYIIPDGTSEELYVYSGKLETRPSDREGAPDIIYFAPTEMKIDLIVESEYAKYFTKTWKATCIAMESIIPTYRRKTVLELLRGTEQELPLDTDVSEFGQRFGELFHGSPSNYNPPEVILSVGVAAMLGDRATTAINSKVNGIIRAQTVEDYMEYLDSPDEFIPYTAHSASRIEIIKAIVYTYDDPRFRDSTKTIFVDYGLNNKYYNLGDYVNGTV